MSGPSAQQLGDFTPLPYDKSSLVHTKYGGSLKTGLPEGAGILMLQEHDS
ncbi:hypothetical protein [Virgibacillus chiguensis]|nr:hypothetical protein [Virgibacillus chiguensis]